MSTDTTNAETAALPATMRAWVYETTKGGIEKNMKLEPEFPVPESFHTLSPPPPGKGDEAVLVRILVASLNPADYKLPEVPVLGGYLQKTPATPAIDFCGRVVRTSAGSGSSAFRPGQLVAGILPAKTQNGSLAEYAVAYSDTIAPVPVGVPAEQAATVGICGSTVWASMVPNIEAAKKFHGNKELRVFINGGSGGIGSYAVPIAKAMGCHVTTTCSTPNVSHVRRVLGADDVIDYRTSDVGEALVERAKTRGQFDVAIDMVGMPFEMYKAADVFLADGAPFTRIAWPSIAGALRVSLQPTWLGGGKHLAPFANGMPTPKGLRSVLELLAQGRVKVPLDGGAVIPLADVPQAYARLKTNRVRGKIVVRVAEDY